MPSPVFQYVINLVVSLAIRRGPGVIRMFQCWNIVLLTNRFLMWQKFTILTPLSLLSWCRLSFPVVGLKIFSLPTYALKSPNRSSYDTQEKIKNCCNSSQKLFFESSVFSSLGACTFRTMVIHQRSFRAIYNILSRTNSTVLTADSVLWCTKSSVPNWWFSFPFP